MYNPQDSYYSHIVSKGGQINSYHQNLESQVGQHFKEKWRLPYKHQSTTDVLKTLATERVDTTTEAILHPTEYMVPFSGLAIFGGYMGIDAIKTYMRTEGALMDKIGAIYKSGVSASIMGRYYAAFGSGVVSLAIGKNYEEKIGGLAFAITDPIADYLGGRAGIYLGTNKTTKGTVSKVLDTMAGWLEKPKLSKYPLAVEKAREWRGMAHDIVGDAIDSALKDKLKMSGRMAIGPLLSIPLWFGMSVGLKAIGRAFDNVTSNIQYKKKQESMSVSEETKEDPMATPNMNININYADVPMDKARIDEMFVNDLTKGYAF